MENQRTRGRKGNKNLEDYIIPVLKCIKVIGDHKFSFKAIAVTLDVRYQTVWSQCTRSIGLKNVDEFLCAVKSGRIIQILKDKYTCQHTLIEREVVPCVKEIMKQRG